MLRQTASNSLTREDGRETLSLVALDTDTELSPVCINMLKPYNSSITKVGIRNTT